MDFKNFLISEKEKYNIPDYMLLWKWAEEYHFYSGPEDLIRWFTWMKPTPNYFPPDLLKKYSKISEEKHKNIFSKFKWKYDYSYVDDYNSTDYIFQNFYPVPDRMRINRILDFGAGFGRQINIWSQMQPGIIYTGMDSIEGSYCLQNLYYSFFGKLVEYVDNPDSFKIQNIPAIYHLPTWRHDLLPDNFFDLIICVQVLQELDEKLVLQVINIFKRCLKRQGMLYIRDHENWQPSHKLDISEILIKNKFVLEFKPCVIDNYNNRANPDIHGIPRIWRLDA